MSIRTWRQGHRRHLECSRAELSLHAASNILMRNSLEYSGSLLDVFGHEDNITRAAALCGVNEASRFGF